MCCTKSGDSGEEKRGNLVIFVESMEKSQDSGQTWNRILANQSVCAVSASDITSNIFYSRIITEKIQHYNRF